MTKKPQRRADGGSVTRVVDPPRPAKEIDVDEYAAKYRKTAPRYNERLPLGYPDEDRKMPVRNPTAGTRDRGEYTGTPVNANWPVSMGVELAKGGKVMRVAGPKLGKEDGLIAVQKGEFVVRKAAAQKHGPAKMAAVNKGTARITVPKPGKR